ncbi:MAG TPA: hypothetical protein VLL54_19370 [Pyrinomonadaceae bacterium]|nr:hypothetical protein [Pyrinomonadaceae bacterium]
MSENELETIDALSEYFQDWPETQSRPENPPVLVTFDGLVDFYYNTEGSNAGACGIGFELADLHHLATVEVFEDGQSLWGRVPIDGNFEVRLGTVNAAGAEQPADAKFLKSGGTDDFRWLIDMQARPWYPGTQTRGSYAARLFVRNGTFFTKSHTKYVLHQALKIELADISHVGTAVLGNPASVVGDEIVPGANEHVLLKVNGEDKPLPNNGKKYEIRFRNICADNTAQGPCDFIWWDFLENKRNDFHHHRDALVLPQFSAKYSVVLAPGELPIGTRDPPGDRNKDNTVDAPCQGAGYSGGGGGPA